MMILAYLGPETMLPMTSVVAGVAGFVMMFGRKAVDLVVGVFKKKPAAAAPQTRARGHRPTGSRTVAGSTPHVSAHADAAEAAESATA
jgi:hypothetical protein